MDFLQNILRNLCLACFTLVKIVWIFDLICLYFIYKIGGNSVTKSEKLLIEIYYESRNNNFMAVF